MRITRRDARRLVIVHFPWLIGAIAFPAAAFMAGQAVLLLAGGDGSGNVVGATIAAAMFFFGGALFTKRSEFDFDLVERKLRWKRRGLFTNAGGAIPLEHIRNATVETTSTGDRKHTYRVVLHTASGAVPLTDSYHGNRDIADRIRTAINQALHLNLDASEQIETDILELTLAGRNIDAISLARQRYGYDLTQAKQFVEGLSN